MSINRAAMKALPIQGYLDWQGIDYTKKGNWVNLLEHDSLVINTRTNRFVWNSRGVAGDLGDFIAATEGVTSKEAWTKWTAYSRYVKNENVDVNAYKQKSEPKEFNYSKWRKSADTSQAYDYLTNVRGLDPQMVKGLLNQGLVQQGIPQRDRETNEMMKAPVLFPWADENRKIVGVDVQGTDVDYEKFGKRGTMKKIGSGSANEDYGYNFKFGNGSDRLIVFEAPIDMLSYMDMNRDALIKENATLMSLSGTNHTKIMKQMERMHEQYGKFPSNITIATDNDLAGYKVAAKMNQFDYTAGSITREVPKEGKDWNDQLKAGKTGVRKMSLDDSDFNLSVIEARLEQANGAPQATTPQKHSSVHEKPAQDPHAVVSRTKPVVAPQPGAQSQKNLNRTERMLKNREANEATMRTARKRFASYKQEPRQLLKHLDFVSLGQQFSASNSILITGQQPEATVVMGHDQFRQRGIEVNKGEEGIRIYGKPKNLNAIVDENGEKVFLRDAPLEKQQAAKRGDIPIVEAKFFPIETVFDIKQTNARMEDLERVMPKRPINLQVDNSPKHLNNIYQEMKHYAEKEGFVVFDKDNVENFKQFEAQTGKPQRGVSSKRGPEGSKGSIHVRSDLSLGDKLATLGHQLGVSQVNAVNSNQTLSPKMKKLQGDMAGYTILRSMNIDADTINTRFMPGWENELNLLKDSNVNMKDFMAETTKASTRVSQHLSSRFDQGEQKQSVTHEAKQTSGIKAKMTQAWDKAKSHTTQTQTQQSIGR